MYIVGQYSQIWVMLFMSSREVRNTQNVFSRGWPVTRNTIQVSVFAILAVAASFTVPAFAQPARGADDEIIITAQRREQAAQSVGIAVSVLRGEELRDRGVVTVNALENVTPSLEVESQFGGGQPSFSLRGVGFKDYGSNNSPTVGVYVDDVAYTLPIMTQGVIFDVARVEVLRGPQGTLYGRNTTGGAVNIITERPTQTFETGFTVEAGRFDAVRGEGFISGPLGGGAAGRLSFSGATGGAWQVNRETGAPLGDADQFAVRGQVSFPVTERLDLLVNLHASRDQSDGLGLQLFKNSTVPGSIAPRHIGRQTSWGFSPQFAATYGFSRNQGPFRDNEGVGGSITGTYDFGAVGLTYIFSHESFDRRELNDWDALPGAIAGVYFVSGVDVTQHELRLASKDGGRFDWIVGAYVANEDLSDLYASDFVDSFGPAATLAVPYRQEVETAAVFGQVEFQATPTVNLIAGLRYEDEQRDLKDFATFFGGVNVASPNGARLSNATGFNELTGRLAVEYAPTDNLLAYASISRGIKSGGFTAYNSFSPDAVGAFEPEEIWAYETGFKSDLFDNALRVNGAIYYYDYTNQQVQNAIFLPTPAPARAVGRISNAPQSRIYGAEIELLWRPIEALSISQAIGYVNAEFEEYTVLDIAASNTPPAAPRGRNASGERLGPPELTYSGRVTYNGVLAGGRWLWNGAIDYSYRSDTDPPLLKAASGEGYGVPAYWLVNANFAVQAFGSPWQFGVWGRNILDEEYDETRNFFAGVDWTPISAPGQPATYGVRIAYRR